MRRYAPSIKGLPIKVKVDEIDEHGEAVSREILSSYEDAYTAELKEMHACFTQGKEIKTSAKDAIEDLRLSEMIFEQYERQQAQPYSFTSPPDLGAVVFHLAWDTSKREERGSR